MMRSLLSFIAAMAVTLSLSAQILGPIIYGGQMFNLLSTACALTFGADGGMQVTRRNLALCSENLACTWTGYAMAVNSATTATFSADNASLYQNIITTEGVSYTLSFKARAISGNTALMYYHNQSATGTYTSGLNLTGSLTQYSITVLGRTGGGAVSFGIHDRNDDGWGQIEVTEWQVEVGSTPTAYQATDAFGVSRDAGLDAWAARWNLLLWSEDLSNGAWTKTDSTANSATLLTFTAQYGRASQAVSTLSGGSYTLSFYARRISGNTALELYHNASETGTSTAFTITDTLTRYNVTVLGKKGGGDVSFGVRDSNASGQGQIEITQFQVSPGTTLRDYQRTESGQRIFDVSLHGKSGYRGSAITAGTDDPATAVVGGYVVGASFDGGDFITLPNLGTGYGITVAIYLPADVTAATTGQTIYNSDNTGRNEFIILGAIVSGLTNEIVTIAGNTTGRSGWCDGAGKIASGWHTIQTAWNGAAWQMWIDNTEKTLTAVGDSSAFVGHASTRIGAVSPTASTYLANSTIVGYFAYHATAPNQKSEYDTAKRKMALRGVTLP